MIIKCQKPDCQNTFEQYQPRRNPRLGTRKVKYCSRECRYGDTSRHDECVFDDNGNAVTRNKSLRRFLMAQQGGVCEMCGTKPQWLGKPMPFILDHIDGNSDNWHESNLRLICSNCDSITETYKSKNRGSGRHYRRERYAQGKSF